MSKSQELAHFSFTFSALALGVGGGLPSFIVELPGDLFICF